MALEPASGTSVRDGDGFDRRNPRNAAARCRGPSRRCARPRACAAAAAARRGRLTRSVSTCSVIVAGMDGGELLHAANHQARADQQQHGEGDLGHHQRAAEAPSAAAVGGMAGRLLEGIAQLPARICAAGASPRSSPTAQEISTVNSATRGSRPGWM